MSGKILSRIFLILMLPLFFSFFIKCIYPLESNSIYEFKMYYLKDSTLFYSDAEKKSLSKLVLQEGPFITAAEIQTFSVIYINGNPIRSYRILLKDSYCKKYADEIRPFVIIINGKRFCLADYWPALFSYLPNSILMTYWSNRNEFRLESFDEAGKEKLRDPIIIKTLKNLGVKIKYVDIGSNWFIVKQGRV